MRNRKKLDVNFENGIITILESMKSLIYQYDEALIDIIGFDNDFVYSEPLLYGYFAMDNSKITLDQILFGYLPKDKRKSQIKVYADQFGVIYLPQIGYFHVNEKSTFYDLIVENDTFNLYLNSELVTHKYENLVFLKSSPSIEVVLYSNPLIESILNKWGDLEQETIERNDRMPIYRENLEASYDNYLLSINDKATALYDKLDTSFDLLKKHAPDEYKRFIRTTRKIVCYDNPYIRGFATKLLQGAVFISVDDNTDEVFFLDELVHQCSHGVFNLMTLPLDEYLKIDPDVLLKDMHPDINQKEERTFYDAYHGLYTITSIIYALLPVYRNHKFNKEQTYNLLGRISKRGIMIRTGVDLIDKENVLTEDGIEIFDFLFEESDEIIAANPDIFDKFDFSNQPYAYSFEKFKMLNGHLMV